HRRHEGRDPPPERSRRQPRALHRQRDRADAAPRRGLRAARRRGGRAAGDGSRRARLRPHVPTLKERAMATIDTTTSSTGLALSFEPQGVEEVPDSTILTRLNYFDGKFLRADDLRLEQDYVRRVAELGARAGGSGLVYGFDVTAGSGDQLTIGGGLAFDPAG